MKILYIYISRQFIKNFLILIGIFSLIVVSSQMLHLPKFVYSMNITDFFGILSLLSLSFAKFQILFGFFIAWLLVGIKLRESNEIYAIYSSGIEKIQILKPVFIWGIIFSIIALTFSTVISPYANRERAKFLTLKVKSYLLDSIQPQSFSKVSENVYVYVNKKEKSRFYGVILQNLSNGFLITAKSGYFKENYVILEDGYIQIPSENSYSLMNFKKYSFSIDVSYLKEAALEDIGTYDIIFMLGKIDTEKKNKLLAILSDRIFFPIPFMFMGLMGFMGGLILQKSKELLLTSVIFVGILYMILNYAFVKMIEKSYIFALIYPVVLILLFGFITIKLYKNQ